MGQEVTLITDGMAAAVLAPASTLGRVDALVTAADRVTMDGHVVNKVGTLGHAVVAHAFGVPFHALVQAPDPQAPTGADVVIEERDGEEVLSVLGVRSASPLVQRGHYPAFDVTPDRKSTRLNSSHANISYAVFCLKKKTRSTGASIPACSRHYSLFRLVSP